MTHRHETRTQPALVPETLVLQTLVLQTLGNCPLIHPSVPGGHDWKTSPGTQNLPDSESLQPQIQAAGFCNAAPDVFNIQPELLKTMADQADKSASVELWDRRMRFTFPSGATPLGGYTIKRGLGIGGFGEVYFAVSDSGKEVALKRIARNLDVELRGVRQCLNLKHANLIGLWDIQIDDHGESWVVMEYVSGPSLRDVLSANPNGLPMDDLTWWFQGICAGVHYLHQNGIVHRDLKPGNIFQDNEAQLVKIGDYGLSKFISCSRRSGHTESVGTVHYMAPEIGRGIYGREIDVYSLGIVLFELITGRVPFEGESTQEIIMKHLTADPDVSSLAAPFDRVVRKSLLKDPEDRYGSVSEMLFDLPNDFWPPAMRRNLNQLQDTGIHVRPVDDAQTGQTSAGTKIDTDAAASESAVASTHLVDAQPGADRASFPGPNDSNRQGERAGNQANPSAAAAKQNSSNTTIVESHDAARARTSPPDTAAQHGASPAFPLRSVLPSVTRFNVPPTGSPGVTAAAGTHARQRESVGPAPSDYSLGGRENSVGASAGEVTHEVSLYRRFSSAASDVVFGDVQFHDVVDAEMVFRSPEAPSEPHTATADSPTLPNATGGRPPYSSVPATLSAELSASPTPPTGSSPMSTARGSHGVSMTPGSNSVSVRPQAQPQWLGKVPQPNLSAVGQTRQSMRLSVRERTKIAEDPAVQTVAGRYLNQMSGVEQFSSLLFSLITAMVAAGAIAIGLLLWWNLGITDQREFDDRLAIATWFWIVSFSSTWILLSVSRLWQPGMISHPLRSVSLVLPAIAAGGFAWMIANIVDIDFAPIQATRQWLIGGFLGSILFREGQPQLSAFVLFFMILFLVPAWWNQTSPLRARRWSWGSTLLVIGVAYAFSAILNFQGLVPVCLAASISLATQWAATCFSDRQRIEIRELSRRP